MGFEISFGHGARIVENCGPTTPHLVEVDINGHFLTFSKRTLNLFLINIYYIIYIISSCVLAIRRDFILFKNQLFSSSPYQDHLPSNTLSQY